jgi:hypothetical protein
MEPWSIIAIATAPIALIAVGLFLVSTRELDAPWLTSVRGAAFAALTASSIAVLCTGAPALIDALDVLAALLALEALAVAAATPPSLRRLADEDPIGRFEREFSAYCRSRPRSANALQEAFSRPHPRRSHEGRARRDGAAR